MYNVSCRLGLNISYKLQQQNQYFCLRISNITHKHKYTFVLDTCDTCKRNLCFRCAEKRIKWKWKKYLGQIEDRGWDVGRFVQMSQSHTSCCANACALAQSQNYTLFSGLLWNVIYYNTYLTSCIVHFFLFSSLLHTACSKPNLAIHLFSCSYVILCFCCPRW